MLGIGPVELALAGLLVLGVAAVLLGPLRAGRERRRAESFARRAGLPVVTPELVRRVRFVVAGTVLGLVATTRLDLWLVPAYAGLALGAVADAVSRPGPPPGTPRVAHATSTRLRDYVPAWLLGVAVATAALGPLLALLWVLAPPTEERLEWYTPASGTSVGGLALASAAGLAASFGLARVVVRRRQPAGTPDELAVDDALRAEAVRDVLQVTTVVSFAVVWVLSVALTGPDVVGVARRIGGFCPAVVLVGLLVVGPVQEFTGGPKHWRSRLVPTA